MKLQRVNPESYPLTLNLKETIIAMYFWSSDGWCYIPDLSVRRKYIVEGLYFNLIEEKWQGLIPVSEYSELVEVSVYSEFPRIWKEESEDFSELYVETTEIQSKSKKGYDRQADQQQ